MVGVRWRQGCSEAGAYLSFEDSRTVVAEIKSLHDIIINRSPRVYYSTAFVLSTEKADAKVTRLPRSKCLRSGRSSELALELADHQRLVRLAAACTPKPLPLQISSLFEVPKHYNTNSTKCASASFTFPLRIRTLRHHCL